MALLRTRPNRRRRLLLGAAATLTLFGCALLQNLMPREEPFGFNHEAHVVGEGMECGDCHFGVEDSDEPGIPPQMACMLCHEEIDSEKEPERQIEQLFVDGQLPGPRVSTLDDEVIFSHLSHVETIEDCSTCHAGIEESTYPGDLTAVTMADCTDCHAESGAPAECSTCHSVIDRDWAPDTHGHMWTRVHGKVCRGAETNSINDCSLCHTETSCTQCHQEEPPADHNNFWRERAHGLIAQLDRARCATCHTTDFCVRCHQETEPRNHVGSFGGTQSNHCVSCHFPLQSSSCATCHEGTPSHLMATPLPPGHTPALDCRSCHPGLAPLPHADKGDSCILCHM
jgi:hypothetical protein